jgi:hypothetical protein
MRNGYLSQPPSPFVGESCFLSLSLSWSCFTMMPNRESLYDCFSFHVLHHPTFMGSGFIFFGDSLYIYTLATTRCIERGTGWETR